MRCLVYVYHCDPHVAHQRGGNPQATSGKPVVAVVLLFNLPLNWWYSNLNMLVCVPECLDA